jgi:hypothetical protein
VRLRGTVMRLRDMVMHLRGMVMCLQGERVCRQAVRVRHQEAVFQRCDLGRDARRVVASTPTQAGTIPGTHPLTHHGQPVDDAHGDSLKRLQAV